MEGWTHGSKTLSEITFATERAATPKKVRTFGNSVHELESKQQNRTKDHRTDRRGSNRACHLEHVDRNRTAVTGGNRLTVHSSGSGPARTRRRPYHDATETKRR